MAHIAEPGRQALTFADSAMGDAGVDTLCASLARNSAATSLDLRGCAVGERGCDQLAAMLHANQALRSLSLEWNALGDAGVAALAPGLAANMTLTALDLRNCRLGPAGARALAETLGASGALSALSTLDLQWNKVGDEGARALAQMARQQRRIVRMELTGNRVPDAALREVMDALSRNQLSQANSGSAVDGGGVGNFNGSYNSSYNNYSRHSPARARLEKRLGDTLQTPGLSVVTTGQHSQLQHLRGAYAAEREARAEATSKLESAESALALTEQALDESELARSAERERAEQFRGGFGARSRTIAHEAAERLARAEAAEARERAAREHAEELENTAEADARRHADFVSELRTAFADAQASSERHERDARARAADCDSLRDRSLAKTNKRKTIIYI